jgi:OmpA-OmpF porin, OOP family
MRTGLIALGIMLMANGALAGGFIENPAVYGGIGLANTHFDDDDQFEWASVDTRDSGIHAFGGYQFNRYLAVELSARDLGEYRADDGYTRHKEEFSAVTIGAVGFLPLGSSGFSLYGRIGAGVVSLDERVSEPGWSDSSSDSGGTSSLGAGIEYRNSGFALRAGWESHFFTVQTTQYFDTGRYIYEDEEEYSQRIDSFGLDIAYYFSL